MIFASQGGHQIPNEWHGIGVAGHVAVAVIAVLCVVFVVSVWLGARR